MNIHIDLPLNIEVPDSETDFRLGLMFRESLEKDSGMLFIFDSVEQQSFHMKNTKIPLDIAFIKEDGTVDSIKELLCEFNIQRETTLVQMWLNINGPYSYNVSHRHPNVELAGVLWVKQTPDSGRFVFDNLDVGYRDAMLINATDREHLEKYKMPPEYVPKYKDGTLCIFPANLTHRVEINETKEDRISISFNIKIM